MTVGRQGTGLEAFERLATSHRGSLLFAGWGLAEAVLFPIVPDVGLYPAVAAVPRAAARLFLAVLGGAIAGSALLFALTIGASDLAQALVLAVPGVDRAVLDQASRAVADGQPASMALVGPGTPLKVFTLAWALGPGEPTGWLAGVVINRLTRIGPGVVVAIVLGLVAPRWVRRHARALLIAYTIGWVALYAVLLS